jgi:hypothetical protein
MLVCIVSHNTSPVGDQPYAMIVIASVRVVKQKVT